MLQPLVLPRCYLTAVIFATVLAVVTACGRIRGAWTADVFPPSMASAQAGDPWVTQMRRLPATVVSTTIEAYKIGKEFRIRTDHLDQAMEARRVRSVPEPEPAGGLWDPDAAA